MDHFISEEELFASYNKNAKRNIKKAQKNGLIATSAARHELPTERKLIDESAHYR